jgi:hypothetical protein
MIQNDTYGEITREELADLRRVAQRCTHCGMLATVDPAFHAARYRHAPTVSRGGVTFTWSQRRHTWLTMPTEG